MAESVAKLCRQTAAERSQGTGKTGSETLSSFLMINIILLSVIAKTLMLLLSDGLVSRCSDKFTGSEKMNGVVCLCLAHSHTRPHTLTHTRPQYPSSHTRFHSLMWNRAGDHEVLSRSLLPPSLSSNWQCSLSFLGCLCMPLGHRLAPR